MPPPLDRRPFPGQPLARPPFGGVRRALSAALLIALAETVAPSGTAAEEPRLPGGSYIVGPVRRGADGRIETARPEPGELPRVFEPQPTGRTCPGPAREPLVTVTHEAPPPRLDATRSLSEMKAMARPPGHAGQPHGLYVAAIEPKAQLSFEIDASDPERICVALREVRFELTLSPRTILVAREHLPGTCAYAAILDHERQHARIDDLYLPVASERLRSRMREALRGATAVAAASRAEIGAVQDAIKARLRASVGRIMSELNQERNLRQLSIDNAFEYGRVMRLCAADFR